MLLLTTWSLVGCGVNNLTLENVPSPPGPEPKPVPVHSTQFDVTFVSVKANGEPRKLNSVHWVWRPSRIQAVTLLDNGVRCVNASFQENIYSTISVFFEEMSPCPVSIDTWVTWPTDNGTGPGVPRLAVEVQARLTLAIKIYSLGNSATEK